MKFNIYSKKNINRQIGKVAALSLALSLVSLGCESDGFEDAPRAQASASPGAASAQNQGQAPGMESEPGGLGPVSGMELPEGHPPLGQGGQEGAGQAAAPAPNVPRAAPQDYGTTGPVLWEAPSGWTARPPSNQMRLAEYYIPGPAGVEPAEVTIFYFGPGGGGGVDANLNRWAGQFENGPEAVYGTEEFHGVKIHTVDASGDFDAGMAMGGGAPKESRRLLGAIAETAEGLYFFRMLGPKEVVDGEADAFQTFLSTFEHAGG